MTMALDPLSIATEGVVCGGVPDPIALATHGHVCFLVVTVTRVPQAGPGGALVWGGHYRGPDYVPGRDVDDLVALLEEEDDELMVFIMAAVELMDD